LEEVTIRLSPRVITHEELKEMAKEYLLSAYKGDEKLDEIKEEYRIGPYVVDLAGFRKGSLVVVVECGNVDHSKIVALSHIVPKVVVIPKYKILDQQRKVMLLEGQVRALENEIYNLKKKLSQLETLISSLKENLSRNISLSQEILKQLEKYDCKGENPRLP